MICHSSIIHAGWQATLTIRRFVGIVGRMVARTRITIRPFDGSLASAEGLLDVERAVFDECPYSAEQVQSMLADGPQRAWLALGGDTVVGFVIAFRTAGLQDPLWEIDLLAVHPQWRGQRLGARLIRASSASTESIPRRARAYVASDNVASAQAFSRVGLRPTPETYTLLIYRTDGPTRGEGWQTTPAPGLTIHEAASLSEAVDWLPDPYPDPKGADQRSVGKPLGSEVATPLDKDTNLTLLLAEKKDQPAGYAVLIGVQTLLYQGIWIETLEAQERIVREALIHGAVTRALASGLDEIGAMVGARTWPLKDSLLAAGFRSLGEFRRYTAILPLPGLATKSSET